MNKRALFWLFVEWLVCLAGVYWLVGGSIWLDLFLASALSHATYLSRRLSEQRRLFDIADAELVRVSSLVDRLEEEFSQIQSKLELTESKITDLEADLTSNPAR